PASDSESSSEEDEFAGARTRCGKGDYLRCCKFCYPLCAFVILAACVVACVGLVWMQVALKEDLDVIKEKFRTMESNQKTSFQEIPKLNEDLVQKQKQLEQIETGELGLSKIWINITEINKQILLLTSTVNHLKNNIKSASDLISLPLTVEKLQKASTVNVAMAKCVLCCSWALGDSRCQQELPELHVRSRCFSCSESGLHIVGVLRKLSELTRAGFVFQDNQSLQAALEELNNTAVGYHRLNDIRLLNVDSALGNLSRRVTRLENSPLAGSYLEKRENLSSSEVKMTSVKSLSDVLISSLQHLQNTDSEDLKTRDSQVSKLREKLQMMSALPGKPVNDRPTETSKNVESSLNATAKPTDLLRVTSRSADGSIESDRQQRHLSLPGISSIKDLQSLFERAAEDADGKLSYEDLQQLLGSAAPESQSLKEFDTDGDEKYSLQELRLALGV
ncbi:EF-hand calcium-binding domain-containing protein 14, partial [Dryobates pubescens]